MQDRAEQDLRTGSVYRFVKIAGDSQQKVNTLSQLGFILNIIPVLIEAAEISISQTSTAIDAWSAFKLQIADSNKAIQLATRKRVTAGAFLSTCFQ